MEKKEIKEVMEVVDLLKMLAERGKREIKGFAIYMIVFGFYIAINTLITLITERYLLWFETLPLAFFLCTIHVSGFLLSFISWFIVALAFFLSVYVFKLPFIFIILILIILSIIAFNVIYGYAYGRKRKRLSVKYPIASRIGILWGVIMAGMAIFYVISGYVAGWKTVGHLATLYWGYATGVGFFISGLVAPFFYVLGILEFILVPFLALKSLSLSYGAFGFLGFLMGIYGIVLWRRGD